MSASRRHIEHPVSAEGDLHWSTSLLTKMTGVVLWTLMLIMFLVALFLIQREADQVKTRFLAQGEGRMHQVAERYLEYTRMQEGLDRILASDTGLPTTATLPQAVREVQARQERELERTLRRERAEGDLLGIVLLTREGTEYRSDGNSDVIDFLRKHCRRAFQENSGPLYFGQIPYRHVTVLVSPLGKGTKNPEAVVAAAVSRDRMQREIGAMRKQVFLIITVVVLLLSFPIIFFLRKWVLQPIREVTAASREISDGNFDKRIPVASGDEIGFLARNFNKMAASLTFRDQRLSRSYERIRSLKDYYDSIVSNAPIGIMSVDETMKVVYENPAMGEILNGPCRTPGRETRLPEIPAFRETRIKTIFRRIMSGEVVEEEGFQVPHPALQWLTLSLKGVPLLDGQGFIQGALLIFVDTTKRTELEERLKKTNLSLEKTVRERTQEVLRTNEKLKQTVDDLYRSNQELVRTGQALRQSHEKIAEANRMKTEFLASMSHELRTPLNAIIGFSDLILSGIDGPISEKQREDLEAVSRSGRNLLHLINDILDLSKIEAGKVSLRKKVMDIRSLLPQVEPLAAQAIGTKPIAFQTHVEDGVRFFYADEGKILQILTNLITNAAKFTDQGEITLSISRLGPGEGKDEPCLCFSVADTGIGISEEDRQMIFNEFEQIDRSSRNAEGSGLGLSITKKLVELGGGRIWVESRHRQGSCFHFTVPASWEQARVTASCETPGAQGEFDETQDSVCRG